VPFGNWTENDAHLAYTHTHTHTLHTHTHTLFIYNV